MTLTGRLHGSGQSLTRGWLPRRPSALAALAVAAVVAAGVGGGCKQQKQPDKDADRRMSGPAADGGADRVGEPELVAAARAGDAGRVRRLIGEGADVNARGPGKITPLMAAAAEGREDVVDVLLERKADANLRDAKGMTAAQWALDHKHGTLAQRLRDAEVMPPPGPANPVPPPDPVRPPGPPTPLPPSTGPTGPSTGPSAPAAPPTAGPATAPADGPATRPSGEPAAAPRPSAEPGAPGAAAPPPPPAPVPAAPGTLPAEGAPPSVPGIPSPRPPAPRGAGPADGPPPGGPPPPTPPLPEAGPSPAPPPATGKAG